MNVKKVIGIILPIQAFNSRNLTSFILVGVFFLTYWAAGGRVTKTDLKTDLGKMKELSNGFAAAPTGSVPPNVRITGDIQPDKTGLANIENSQNGDRQKEVNTAGSSSVKPRVTNSDLESLAERLRGSKPRAQ